MADTVRAVLVHAADDPGMGEVVAGVRRILEGMGCAVSTKQAALARVPDLAAADLVILGAAGGSPAGGGPAPVPDEFSELLRSLQGVTLAGRAVAAFSLGGGGALNGFRAALRDCEVPLLDSCFLEGARSAGEDALEAWLRPLVQGLRESTGAG